ncbi:MAG: hypothetical protein US69_C0008G0027 [candidate division TM6 bacterium GW2011_GWF2_38_10]|nr:MAG: hypothetical protein US69_C0008G0027 [candidate division TM6 bacterium GW2011_GWF2_38_10]
MKKIVLLGLLITQSIICAPIIVEDDRYVTIFDSTNFLHDTNYNLIRLYKIPTKPKYRKQIPSQFSYDRSLGSYFYDLQREFALLGKMHGYKHLVTDKYNKDYFYKTFSWGVDTLLFQNLNLAGTDRFPGDVNVWNIPGEIIYFDADSGLACEVEIGSFQYTITRDGVCSDRNFSRWGRYRVVVDHNGVEHIFSTFYHNVDRMAVCKQIERFVQQQKMRDSEWFSPLWTKQLRYTLDRFAKEYGLPFI